MTGNLFILDHPLKGGYLKKLRDKNTSPEDFRKQALLLGQLLAIESTRDLQAKEESCETPLCETTENVIHQVICLVPILRAGIGLVDPFLNFLPQAQVHFLGMYRHKETRKPVHYYNKLPEGKSLEVAYVLDPMLATGGSALATIQALKDWGAKTIKFVGLIGAPEGVKALQNDFPEVDIHLAALDDHLNENLHIVPGLGDSGDRIFNTFG